MPVHALELQQYAVDYDGDGSATFGPPEQMRWLRIANFLRALGWNDDLTLWPCLLLPSDFDSTLADGKTSKSLRDWDTLGIRRLNGTNLPERPINARSLRPARAGGKAYLIYDNFDVLMKWNRSHYFVISVGTLSDQSVDEHRPAHRSLNRTNLPCSGTNCATYTDRTHHTAHTRHCVICSMFLDILTCSYSA